MKLTVGFIYFGISMAAALYGVHSGQIFEIFAISAVGAFLLSFLGGSVATVSSYNEKHEILSAIFSAFVAMFFCAISFGVILILRYAKVVI